MAMVNYLKEHVAIMIRYSMEAHEFDSPFSLRTYTVLLFLIIGIGVQLFIINIRSYDSSLL